MKTLQEQLDKANAQIVKQAFDALAKPVQERVAHSVISGALFDFMGWLTSRKERLVLSSADNASPAVDAIRDFATKRGLSLDDAQVLEWTDALAQPVQEPVSAAEVQRLRFLVDSKNLDKLYRDLHLVEEICEFYAKCDLSVEALRDWVAERMDTSPQPVQEPYDQTALALCEVADGKR
jgi:hypothetical protein